MRSKWLQYATLRIASLLAPGGQRAEWLKEWHSELWYIPPRRATYFCLGAFRDAFWLRRLSPVTADPIPLESPLQCLALLTTFAGASIFFATRLEGARNPVFASRHVGYIAAILLSGLLLAATTSPAFGDYLANRHPMPWASRLRRWIFLFLKIALLLLPIAAWGFFPGCILAFPWALRDQRRRCPVCLRLLTNSVRIGNPSQTFLEWYGAESMCSRGHGLLHVPGIATSYGKQRWLTLDGSWAGIFSETAGVRHG